MKKIFFILGFAIIALAINAQTINLAGEWKFSMGEKPQYNDKITLPGSMLTNGKGNDVSVKTQWIGSLYDSSFYFNPYMEKYRVEGNMKFPFFLTPKKHYVGTAWYSKTVNVPDSWKGRSVVLHLERPHIESTVFINGKEAGRDSSLSVPHVFDVTNFIIPGKENEIAIRIYNGIENVCVGQDSHSVTDQTQGDWNGIIGRMELQCRPKYYIQNVMLYPNAEKKEVKVSVLTSIDPEDFENEENRKGMPGRLTVKLDGKTYDLGLHWPDCEGYLAGTVKLSGDIHLWDEFTPYLYNVEVSYLGSTFNTQFGFRDISTEGRKMILNGHEIFIRGTVGNCCFPLTGYPPTDVDSWLAIFRKCKQYGLNMMRFHSYCPPEAAFIAADQVGFYLQPEGPSWPNHGVKLGNKMTIDRYLLEETQRMVEQYGNHPSFLFLAAGNEPAGNWVKWVGDFVDYWHSTGDTRRLYCGASVGGGWAFDPKSDYHVKGGARGLDWDRKAPQTMDDYAAQVTQFVQKGRTPITFDINEPYLSHEQGQWCAFPDFKEIDQYTGAYKAGNFEIFRDLLRDNGMETQAEKFLYASSMLQNLAYKFETERNLRTPNYTGFQYLGLNDYSGQGTALVGPLNVFWREKSYVYDTLYYRPCPGEEINKEIAAGRFADTWTMSCAPVVPLARMPKFVFTEDDVLTADIMLYNATADSTRNMPIFVSIEHEGDLLEEGFCQMHSAKVRLPIGKNHIGTYSYPIAQLVDSMKSYDPEFTLPHKFFLRVQASFEDYEEGDTQGYNAYDFWVYPSQTDYPKLAKNVYVCDTLDAKAEKILKKGGRVLLTAAGRVTMGDDIKQTYLPVFWNTSWFKMRPPHTTGAYIDATHPLFKNFITDDWGNLNWWELLNKAQVINLQDFPRDYQPAIQPIDTWHVSRKLGMMAEANIGKGKLLITTMDISSDLANRPVARQMRKALMEYVNGNDFNPSITVDLDVIKSLYTKRAKPVNMFTNDSPDELKPKLK